MIQLLRTAWDRLSIYLPLMLMGLLALGTYWLVRSTPRLTPPSSQEAVRKDPDYLLERFALKTYGSDGRLKAEVSGEQGRHYPDTDFIEVDQVRIRSFNPRGVQTLATAQRALTNGDASEVQLMRDAQVVREAAVDTQGVALPRLSLRSEFLYAQLAQERISTNKPVELMRGQDRITADSMDYSHLDQVLELRGRVRGTLWSAPAR